VVKPDEALKTLLEQSSRVEAAVISDRSGKIVGATIDETERAQRLADAARALLEEAERRRPEKAAEPLAQLEVATPEGSAFVVQDGERVIAATTGPEPTVGLVFYDMKKALRDLDEEKPKERAPAKKKPAGRKKTDDAGS
jgi:predicted regulator of Ras-like GTPase activity (Roadblock/LC7/MglB family)